MQRFAVCLRAAQEAQPIVAAQVRGYLPSLSVEFTDGVNRPKAPKLGTSISAEWNATKSVTEKYIRLLQAYKDVGDAKKEPYLKYHNPRTFEDFDKPIPNFRKFNLKAGEVPKFFDTVLQKRAEESVAQKNQWWEERRTVAEAEISAKPIPTLQVPKWEFGKPVPLAELNRVTDSYIASLEPSRKLKLPTFPAQVQDALTTYATSLGQAGSIQDIKTTLLKLLAEKAVVLENGKVVPGFKFMTKTEAEAKLAERRKEVHQRWVKLWARQVSIFPEQSLIPLKERDALIGSTFEQFSPKYTELVDTVAFGTEPFAERLLKTAEMQTFFMKRGEADVREAYPVTEKDLEAVSVAKSLEDRSFALNKLLGPTVLPEGSPSRLPSEEVELFTEHLYTSDRYFYNEGKKLAARLKADEAALLAELQATYGEGVDLKSYIRNPPSPVTQLFDKLKALESQAALFKAQHDKVADNPYLSYALAKQQELASDPSNIAFEEVLYPELVEELLDIGLKELADKERQVEEAEEEELWTLTMLAQSRHIHQHLDVDLPQAAIAYMDPILYKKLDWELTHGEDILHHELKVNADSPQGEYFLEQNGLENLSHHFLPLIRYRRKKYKKLLGFYPAEVSNIPATASITK